jgi:ribosomal protein L11 methylase PrmA
VMGLSLRSQTQVYLGLFEKETHPWLNRLSKGISTAIDIGVAQGEYTIYFLTKTEATKVFAFEPDVSCIPFLQENCELNGVDQSDRLEISTRFVGVSDTEQEIRLDSLAESVHAPCLVKMDVDGAEEQILKGAKLFNSLPGVRWLIETHSKELEVACEKILTAAGFQTRIVPNAWWRIFVPELRPGGQNRWLAAWKSEEPTQ